jgi:hypothetical protein
MVAPTLAYFTDYTTAHGTVAVALGYRTTFEEEVDIQNNTKTFHIFNDENSNEACWVRARAVAGSDVTLEYTAATGWTLADGWYEYDTILQPGDEATGLTVKITFPKGYEGDQKNVVVLYESAKVTYDADGNPVKPTEDTWKPVNNG